MGRNDAEIEKQNAQQQWVVTNLDTLRSSVALVSRELYDNVVAAILEDQLQLTSLRLDLDKLKEFARHIIRTECWSFDVDGGDAQGKAEELGLIVPHVATKEDVDDEFDDYEVGDTIFKFSEMLKEKD